MASRHPKVDAYIERQADFARPILTAIRKRFHKASPNIRETIKWGAPFFIQHGIVGFMAGFKQHVRWGLWKPKLVKDPHGVLKGKPASLSDLPSEDRMVELIRQAVQVNQQSFKPAPRKRNAKPPPVVPRDLTRALKKNAKATAVFEMFSPNRKREYVEWIDDAKQDETRTRRLKQSVEWIAQGKGRNWKYERKSK